MNLCLCGAQDGYPHYPDCPYPLFRATEAQEETWVNCYEAIKAKQQATQRILDRRAAAGLLDADTAAETMTAARRDIAAGAEAMTAAYGSQDAPQDYRIANRPGNPNWHGVKAWFDEAAALLNDADFSAANDAALMSADQYEDWLDWQWSIGDTSL